MKRFVCILEAGVSLAAALALTGCGSGATSYSILGTGQSFTQSNNAFNNEIDILWVVDNSSSMSPLQANLTSNFNSFISNFQTKGYDFHMAITTTDVYKSEASFSNNPALAKFSDGVATKSGIYDILSTTPNLDSVFLDNATQGISGSGDERAFSSMRDALNSSLNTGFLRSSSFFAVIILSDEDDFSNANRPEESWTSNATDHCYYNSAMDTVATTSYSGPNHVSACANLTPRTVPDTVASYETYLDTLTQSTGATRRYNVNTISVLDSTCQAQHAVDSNVTIVGQRYIQMTNDLNGIKGSICDTSYATSLDSIQSNIATLSTQFFLNKTPQVNTIVVTVNGAFVAENATNGWQYSSAANSILFYGTAIPAQGAQIGVNFIPQTIQ